MARHLLCGSSWLRAGLFVSSPYRLRHLFMTLYKSKCSLFGEMVHASYYAQSLTVQQKQTKKQNTEGSKSSKPVVDNDALWYHQRTVVVWVQSYTGEQVVLTSVVTEAGVLLTLGSSQAPVNWQSDNQDSVEVDAHGISHFHSKTGRHDMARGTSCLTLHYTCQAVSSTARNTYKNVNSADINYIK